MEETKPKTHTRGNVIVEDIEVGDIHYEFEYGTGIKSEVTTLPTIDEHGSYIWKGKNLKGGNIIDYCVNPKYPHYAPNLYDYEAYKVDQYI